MPTRACELHNPCDTAARRGARGTAGSRRSPACTRTCTLLCTLPCICAHTRVLTHAHACLHTAPAHIHVPVGHTQRAHPQNAPSRLHEHLAVPTRVHTHTHTPPVCSHPALPPDCSVGLRAHAFPLLFLHTCTRTDLPHRACTRMPTAISVHTHKPTLLHTPHTPLCTLFPPPACTLTPSTVLHSRTHACTPRALHTHTHTHSLVQAPPACTHTAAPQAPTSCTRLHTPCPCTPQHPPHCSHLHAQLRARTRVCSARPAFHACTPALTPLHTRRPRFTCAPRPQPPARALPRMAAAAARAARCRAL